MRPYKSWKQVAGYFDGDGNISISDLSNQPFKLRLSLIFTDASIEQISMIRDFFLRRKVQPGNVLRTSKGTAWIVVVSRFDGVLTVLKRMLPYLYKKANEAKAAIDYYEGRISGDDLVQILRQESDAGRRERRPHKVVIHVPFTFPQGDLLMKEGRKLRLRDALGKFKAKVTPEDYKSIREAHFKQGKRLRDLVKEYPQYARETIRRVLGGGRGYVGVKGVGRVDTTDSR